MKDEDWIAALAFTCFALIFTFLLAAVYAYESGLVP